MRKFRRFRRIVWSKGGRKERGKKQVVEEAGERGELCVTCAFHFPARELRSPPSAAVTSRVGMMQYQTKIYIEWKLNCLRISSTNGENDYLWLACRRFIFEHLSCMFVLFSYVDPLKFSVIPMPSSAFLASCIDATQC